MYYWLRKYACVVTAGLFLLGAAGQSAHAATSRQVDEAIKKAQAYILSQMKGDNWESSPPPGGAKGGGAQSDPVKGRQWGGTTAVAVYGLLSSGMNPKNPRIAPAIEWLKKAPIGGHYACGMRAQVWTFLQGRETKLASTPDFKILLHGLISEGENKGLYPYYTDLATGQPQTGWADHSVSQFGVLGMWACEQAGQEVPTLYWQVVDAKWKADQQADGGWSYKKGKPVSATMTNAGVATLFITQDYLLLNNNWSICRGGIRNANIERGLAWLDKHFDEAMRGGQHHFYSMYGVERIGVASGRKYFGTHDWYKVGADELVQSQNRNGSWGRKQGREDPKMIPDTVFATIFLVRGRAPIVLNKLEYDNTGNSKAGPSNAHAGSAKKQEVPWNERPRDAYNFAHWAGTQLEQYLNFQIVNLKVPSEELHDAPIIYIAGSEALNFSDEEVRKLREFVEDGGMLLGNADCGSPAFSKSFTQLGAAIFPKYEFRDLPANHPIYTQEQYHASKWRTKPKVMGLSNGIRELMILIPDADLGRWWQTRAEKTRQDMYELSQNIFLYSVDKKNLRYRGDTYIVTANPRIKTTKKLTVARLMVGDNPNPEPSGWRRLANILHNQDKIEVSVEDVKLGEGKLKNARLAHLTGTTKFTLTLEQEKELKDYLAGGGTLVIDAAGGSTEFADAAEKELAKMFGGTPGAVGTILPPTSPVFTMPTDPELPKERQPHVGYREFARNMIAGRLNVPRLQVIKVGERDAVFYSREDLSNGMVGAPVDGVLGYDVASATAIMKNLAVMAANGKGSVAEAKE